MKTARFISLIVTVAFGSSSILGYDIQEDTTLAKLETSRTNAKLDSTKIRPNLRSSGTSALSTSRKALGKKKEHDEIYPDETDDDNHNKDPYGDDDEKYPDDEDDDEDDDEEPPIVDGTDDEGRHDESSSPSKYVQLSLPDEYIEFKSAFHLRHDTVLELHDLVKNSNVVFVNGKHYNVDLDDGFTPMDIYVDDGAEYHLDGVDQSEKLYSSSCSVYMRRQGTDAILISREQRHNDESGELEFTGQILSIDIMGEYGGDFHLAAVAHGVLATVKPEDVHPDHKARLESLEMKGLFLPKDVRLDDDDDEDNNDVTDTNGDNNAVVKNLTSDQIVEMERNRRTTKRHLSSGCSQYFVEDLAVVFDSTYCAQRGGHAQTKTTLESIVSKSSMVYQRQGVCTKVKISVYEGHCSANYDPYKDALKTGNIGCNGVDGVLQWFRNYWVQNRQTKPRAAAHFFFAKDFPESTIGCAWVNVLCKKKYAYGANDMNYSQNTYILGVLLAHELGHNNGLSHVSGSHGDPFIMGPYVKNGENTWSSESITSLHNIFPTKGCITKETAGNTCTDTPSGWHDQDGSNYNCGWYALGSNCADYGHGWKHMGKNAAEACCACGGGVSSFYTDGASSKKKDEKNRSKVSDDVTCGCPTSCTSELLSTMIDDKSIEERISWIVQNLNESEEEACELVCGEEFDDICGDECNPSTCKVL